MEEELACRWEEPYQGADGIGLFLCHHPLRQGFCDYIDLEEDEVEQEFCPFFRPVHESSLVEEETRQFLEYTEPNRPEKKGAMGVFIDDLETSKGAE